MGIRFYSHLNGNSICVEERLINGCLGFEIIEGITQCGYKPESEFSFDFERVVVIATNYEIIRAVESNWTEACISKILYIGEKESDNCFNASYDITFLNEDEIFVSNILYRRKIITQNKKIIVKNHKFLNSIRQNFPIFFRKKPTSIIEQFFSAEKPTAPFHEMEITNSSFSRRDLAKIALSGVIVTKNGESISQKIIRDNVKLKNKFMNFIESEFINES